MLLSVSVVINFIIMIKNSYDNDNYLPAVPVGMSTLYKKNIHISPRFKLYAKYFLSRFYIIFFSWYSLLLVRLIKNEFSYGFTTINIFTNITFSFF